MRIIRAAEGRRTPWKNGGGWTTEIAVHPAGAGLDDFVWRLSTAHVAQDGPFSCFPGVDRTLAILEGEGLDLVVHGRELVVTLDKPATFPGDVPTAARLRGGAVTDLNIMTRRAAARHRLRRIAVPVGRTDIDGDLGFVYCAEGEIAAAGAPPLHPGDCAIVSSAPLVLTGSGVVYVIDVAPQVESAAGQGVCQCLNPLSPDRIMHP